jgi:hypothetical protein
MKVPEPRYPTITPEQWSLLSTRILASVDASLTRSGFDARSEPSFSPYTGSLDDASLFWAYSTSNQLTLRAELRPNCLEIGLYDGFIEHPLAEEQLHVWLLSQIGEHRILGFTFSESQNVKTTFFPIILDPELAAGLPIFCRTGTYLLFSLCQVIKENLQRVSAN